MTHRRRLIISLAALVVMGFVLSIVSILSAEAADLGTISPKPDSSGPSPYQGVHVFWLRKNTDQGQNKNVSLSAFYPLSAKDSWDSLSLEITAAGEDTSQAKVCDVANNSSDYLRVTLSAGTKVRTYNFDGDQVCKSKSGRNATGSNSGNAFYGLYALPPLPGKDDSTQNQFYRVDIDIAYGSSAPQDAGGVGFKVKADSGNPKIGPRGGGNFSFPVITEFSMRNKIAGDYTTIKVPFAMACNDNQLTRDVTVGLYDADNGPKGGFPENNLTFQVWDITDNNPRPIAMREAIGGKIYDKTFRPDNGERGKSFATITTVYLHKYEIRVDDLNPGNTIDILVPFDTIYGDSEVCKEPWRIVPTSYVYDDGVPIAAGTIIRQPGDWVEFSHQIKNVGTTTSNTITWTPKWSGNKTGNVDPPPRSGKLDAKEVRTAPPNGTYRFKIPDTAQTRYEYCQSITADPHSWQDLNNSITSEPACVRVIRPTPCTTCDEERKVNVVATVTGSPAVETQTDTTFIGSATVSNFPRPEQGGWGYSEFATQRPASRVLATPSGNNTNGIRYDCPSGYSPNTSPTPVTCTKYTMVSAPQGSGGGYNCQLLPGFTGVTNGQSGAAKTCQVKSTTQSTPQYRCTNGGNWVNDPSQCKSYYTCPNGAKITGTNVSSGWYASAPSCDGWLCNYTGPPAATQQNQFREPKCEFRCYGTDGQRPYLNRNNSDTEGTGDLRCFVKPKFQVVCRWDDGQVTPAVMVDQDGTSNGAGQLYCNSTSTRTTGNIGDSFCPRLTVMPLIYSGSWQVTPLPGYGYDAATRSFRQMVKWTWNLSSSCAPTNVVGMPYVKVFGGDVRVGGGVGATSETCTPNNTATIKTYNNGAPTYSGSGTQYAAFARDFIDRFVSGQYNSFTRPDRGNDPTKLTFANNMGGTYGGKFGSNGACYNYVEKLPADTIRKSGATLIGGQTVNSDQKPIYVNGNAYISGSIIYNAAARTAASQIPFFELVVEGNIYIDASVAQLDGLYVALPTVGDTGNIYTCSFVNASGPSATLPTMTFLRDRVSNCKRQLVVNGAFAAKQVKFGRDCGSLRWSESDIGTQYFGGINEQTCNVSNHAAELFNFTPEVWIRSVSGGGSTKYDSISSMPPIL